MRRLTPALLTLIMFGVVGLLIAAYVAKNLLAVEQKAPEPTEELIPMAIADLAPGTRVTEAHLGRGPYPKDKLEADMLRTNRVITDRFTRVALKSGQPIRANDLLPPGEFPSLKVAEGMRAVSVEVGGNSGGNSGVIDGMIKTGEFVDVLFTYQGGTTTDDAIQGGITLRLFEGVRILAVNRGTQGRGDRNSSVTLELTEPQANILTLARDRGTITLTINPNGRGTGGLAVSSNDRVTLYEILGLKPADPIAEPFMTEIYRGSGRSTNHFNDKGRLIDGGVNTFRNDYQQQRQRLIPATPNDRGPSGTPGIPVRPADNQGADGPTSPTAARILSNQK